MGRVERIRVPRTPVDDAGTFYCSGEYEHRDREEFDGLGPYVHARNADGGPHDTHGYPAHVDGDDWVVLIPGEVPDVDADVAPDGVG